MTDDPPELLDWFMVDQIILRALLRGLTIPFWKRRRSVPE
jgi:hypothetical protein